MIKTIIFNLGGAVSEGRHVYNVVRKWAFWEMPT